MGSQKATVRQSTASRRMTSNTDTTRPSSLDTSRTTENSCSFTSELKKRDAQDNCKDNCKEGFVIAIDTSRTSIVDNFVSMASQEANFVPGKWERSFRQMSCLDSGSMGL